MTMSRASSGVPHIAAGDARAHPLREVSDQSVLEAIFREGPTTRPAIARTTGLSKPTVSEAVRRLADAGLITQEGERRGRPGRVPTLFGIHPSVGYVIGIDVGGSNVRVACADIFGNVVSEAREETELGARRLPSQLLRLVRQLLDAAGVQASALLSFGISTPGVVDPVTQHLRLAYNLGVDDELDLAGPLQREYGVATRVENNVNLAAVGERWRGLAHDKLTFAFVSVGAGIGMGLVYDDKLIRGTRGAAGEIGYLPLATEPLHSTHRRRGGLEDEAGGSALLETAQAHPQWGDTQPQSVAEVFRAAAAGDQAAAEVVAREGRLVALAVTSLCAVIDPGLVILGGGIGANPLLRDIAREVTGDMLPFPPRIETSGLGDAAALYGATAVALRAAREELTTHHFG